MRRYFYQSLRYLSGVSLSTYAFTNIRMTSSNSDGSHGGRYTQSTRNIAPGIARFDIHIASRDTLGPNHMPSAAVALPDGRTWLVQAVLDNHLGSDATKFISNNIIHAVIGAMADLFSKNESPGVAHSSSEPSPEFRSISDGGPAPPSTPTTQAIQEELVETFLRVDDDLVNFSAMLAGSRTSRRDKSQNILKPALAGTSTLLTFYETIGTSRVVHVAQVGGTRAILGRKNGDKYDAHALGTTPSTERSRIHEIKAAHPGEKDLIQDKKLFGAFPLCAFGLGPLKWARDVRERLALQLDDDTWKKAKSAPYISAGPDVSFTEIESGDVLVMASGSLFSTLSDQEVMEVVGSSLKDSQKSVRPKLQRVKLLGWGDDESEGDVTLSVLAKDWESSDRNLAKALADKADVKLDKDEALSIGVMVFQ